MSTQINKDPFTFRVSEYTKLNPLTIEYEYAKWVASVFMHLEDAIYADTNNAIVNTLYITSGRVCLLRSGGMHDKYYRIGLMFGDDTIKLLHKTVGYLFDNESPLFRIPSERKDDLGLYGYAHVPVLMFDENKRWVSTDTEVIYLHSLYFNVRVGTLKDSEDLYLEIDAEDYEESADYIDSNPYAFAMQSFRAMGETFMIQACVKVDEKYIDGLSSDTDPEKLAYDMEFTVKSCVKNTECTVYVHRSETGVWTHTKEIESDDKHYSIPALFIAHNEARNELDELIMRSISLPCATVTLSLLLTTFHEPIPGYTITLLD